MVDDLIEKKIDGAVDVAHRRSAAPARERHRVRAAIRQPGGGDRRARREPARPAGRAFLVFTRAVRHGARDRHLANRRAAWRRTRSLV